MYILNVIAILTVSCYSIKGSSSQDTPEHDSDIPYSGMMAEGGEANPEDAEMDKAIAEYRETLCYSIFGECWLGMKTSGLRYTEEQRTKICLKKIKGFVVCSGIPDDRTEAAKADAERTRKEHIEHERKLRRIALKREKMLAKEEEVAKLRWERLKEKSKAKRLEKAMLTSTPNPNATVPQESTTVATA